MYMAMNVADSPANYRGVPPVEDYRDSSSDTILEAELPVDTSYSPDFYSTGEWITSDDLAKWTYFLLGCAIFLPWNALTNATSFFLSRMDHTPFHPIFSSCLSSVFTVVKLLCLFYCTVTSKRSYSSRRIIASTITTILVTISVCLSTYMEGTPSGFFSFALFNAASLAVTSSYLCAAVYAQAAVLGSPFLQCVLSGQAAIAVAVSVVQVVSAMISVWGLSRTPTVSLGLLPPDGDYHAEEIAARSFFGFTALFLVMTLAAYTWLTGQTSFNSPIISEKVFSDVEDIDELTGLVSGVRRRVSTGRRSLVYRVLKQNWIVMFAIAYVYTVTLAIYPRITVRVQSVNPTIPPVLFTALHFLLFNAGDLVGRQICSFPRFIVWSVETILNLSLGRTLFIPLIFLCNIHHRAASTIPLIINSDILYFLILFAMGYTNGFVLCTAILSVSSPERNPRLEGRHDDVDVVAALSGTFTIVGMASGALSSFSVQAIK